MKIIDLLNKIANGDIPKRIKYENHYYDYSKLEKDYYEGMGYDYEYFFGNISLIECLNDEVEILEEEKKIPEKLNLKLDDWTTPTQCDIELSKKIDEIIDYLKSKGD